MNSLMLRQHFLLILPILTKTQLIKKILVQYQYPTSVKFLKMIFFFNPLTYLFLYSLVGGLRSPVKRQWSAGESNLTRDLSRDLSRTSDLDVRPRLPPRPKSEFFNVGDANKCSKSSTYEVSRKIFSNCLNCIGNIQVNAGEDYQLY